MLTLPLKEMSRTEKLMALEALWDDLSRTGDIESPAWHLNELSTTEERVKAGQEQFVDWEAAKEELRKRLG